MDRFFDDLARAYDHGIQAPGKELHFLVLVAFLLSFGFIRTSAHMIKAQVSWWPGNVETKGGTHVHHMVWGILLLLSMGYIGIAIIENQSPWAELVAIGFGIGMGLTLDEFALWLNLEDVYWSHEGAPVDRRRRGHGVPARNQPAGPAVLDRRVRGGADALRRTAGSTCPVGSRRS